LNPFQKGAARACDRCEYQGICRIDPWRHTFRVLSRSDAATPFDPQRKGA
jgi:hypothetical protein